MPPLGVVNSGIGESSGTIELVPRKKLVWLRNVNEINDEVNFPR